MMGQAVGQGTAMGEWAGEERRTVEVSWPSGAQGPVPVGMGWMEAAAAAGLIIPTACLEGSCGACEIEVNGRIVRACIATVPPARSGRLTVELAMDPHW